MPFQAASRVEIPIQKATADNALQPLPPLLNVMSTAVMAPATIRDTPRPRANITRGRLPLQMVQRMKLGWAW